MPTPSLLASGLCSGQILLRTHGHHTQMPGTQLPPTPCTSAMLSCVSTQLCAPSHQHVLWVAALFCPCLAGCPQPLPLTPPSYATWAAVMRLTTLTPGHHNKLKGHTVLNHTSPATIWLCNQPPAPGCPGTQPPSTPVLNGIWHRHSGPVHIFLTLPPFSQFLQWACVPELAY